MFSKLLLEGLTTYIPGYSFIPVLKRASMKNAGKPRSARYFYTVWLRHLVMAYRNGLSTLPETVAELGPGDSLGIGLAALLSGSSNYCAFDVVQFADTTNNVLIFDELVKLFRQRVSIPDESEFPSVKPYLDCYEFPAHILTDERLQVSLDKYRVESIRHTLTKLNPNDPSQQPICYFAPWDNSVTVKDNSVDMIYSQAVLEHVEDLEHTYQMLYRWLKPGGFMSHEIDFKCHGSADQWNGHWTYSELTWRLMRGTRPYLLNRQPHSTHTSLLTKNGFQRVCDHRIISTSSIRRKQLSRRFRNLSDEDLMTSSAFMQAVKLPIVRPAASPAFHEGRSASL
jgi:predicted SAM-dependent methyltransferase